MINAVFKNNGRQSHFFSQYYRKARSLALVRCYPDAFVEDETTVSIVYKLLVTKSLQCHAITVLTMTTSPPAKTSKTLIGPVNFLVFI